MELRDLNDDERLALVALSRAIVRADGAVSPKEGETIAAIAAALGPDVYRESFAAAVQQFGEEAALKRFLSTIRRPEARELIFDTILELATTDALSPAEVDILRWLEAAWKPPEAE